MGGMGEALTVLVPLRYFSPFVSRGIAMLNRRMVHDLMLDTRYPLQRDMSY